MKQKYNLEAFRTQILDGIDNALFRGESPKNIAAVFGVPLEVVKEVADSKCKCDGSSGCWKCSSSPQTPS